MVLDAYLRSRIRIFPSRIGTRACIQNKEMRERVNSMSLLFLTVLRIRVRDPVPFWPLDPGSGINSMSWLFLTVLRIRDRDSVHFWPLDPGSEIGFSESRILDFGSRILDFGSRIPNPYVWDFSDNCLGKKFYISLKIGPNFFLQHFKNKIIDNFVKFEATEKGMTKNFNYSLLLLFLDRGSEIRDPGFGIRDG
jgi:hypothetical protein